MFKPINLVRLDKRIASANFTAVANSKALGALNQIMDNALFYLNVTVVAGTTPTLDIDIKATVNGVQYTLGSFAQATAATTEVITIANCPQDIQISTIITGTTPSFDYEVNMTR